MTETMVGCIYKDVQFILFSYLLLKQNIFLLVFVYFVLFFKYKIQVRNVSLQYLTVTFV